MRKAPHWWKPAGAEDLHRRSDESYHYHNLTSLRSRLFPVSRLRTIKPGFFTNEELGECDPLARLMFAGLWTEADRDGRLEDRPKRLKATILPYDDCDGDALLAQLAAHGFIVRYEKDGEKYIAIPQWYSHQKPHPKEASHDYPAPPKRRVLQGSREKVLTSNDLGDDEPGCLLSSVLSTPPTPPRGKAEVKADLFNDRFWPLWPQRHGAKKVARDRFVRHTTDEQQAILTALSHFVTAFDSGRYPAEFLPRAENFVGGQKSYWEEWRDGPPAKYRNGNGNGNGHPAPKDGYRWACFTDPYTRVDEWKEVPV